MANLRKINLIINATEIYTSMLASILKIDQESIEIDLTCNDLNDLMINELKAEGLEFKKYHNLEQLHANIEDEKVLIRLNGKDKSFFKQIINSLNPDPSYDRDDALFEQRRDDQLNQAAENIQKTFDKIQEIAKGYKK